MMSALFGRALLQNAATMSASLSVGDLACQCIEICAKGGAGDEGSKRRPGPRESLTWYAAARESCGKACALDFERTSRMAFAGLCVQGPLIHWLYHCIDHFLGKKQNLATVLRKICASSAFAPVHICAVFGTVAALRGDSAEEIATKVTVDFPKAYLAGFFYWPVVNLGNFLIITAPETRVKVHSAASLLYSVFLTFAANTPNWHAVLFQWQE